ncbi:hypothetical protein [Streptomyces sp. NPDC058308]|uniref:hypothetical protein n=1 Tax=Streptomyces sp. NPDC058308 TaxID=3346440 RepID=UPI0036E01F17
MSACRIFVLGRKGGDDAFAEVQRLAAVLVRARIANRYGVSARKVPGQGAWGVYLTDRTPELGPPSLAVLAVFRSFGLAA